MHLSIIRTTATTIIIVIMIIKFNREIYHISGKRSPQKLCIFKYNLHFRHWTLRYELLVRMTLWAFQTMQGGLLCS